MGVQIKWRLPSNINRDTHLGSQQEIGSSPRWQHASDFQNDF